MLRSLPPPGQVFDPDQYELLSGSALAYHLLVLHLFLFFCICVQVCFRAMVVCSWLLMGWSVHQ
jgi:hypothetical protein